MVGSRIDIHGNGSVRDGVLRCMDVHMVRSGNMCKVLIILIIAVILWWPRKKKGE